MARKKTGGEGEKGPSVQRNRETKRARATKNQREELTRFAPIRERKTQLKRRFLARGEKKLAGQAKTERNHGGCDLITVREKRVISTVLYNCYIQELKNLNNLFLHTYAREN